MEFSSFLKKMRGERVAADVIALAHKTGINLCPQLVRENGALSIDVIDFLASQRGYEKVSQETINTICEMRWYDMTTEEVISCATFIIWEDTSIDPILFTHIVCEIVSGMTNANLFEV